MPSSGVQTCALDRKSTRLNSSHTLISYAVFCLKKQTCSDGDPASGDVAVDEAFDSSAEFWDLFADVFARPSVDGKGSPLSFTVFFFFNDAATTEIYTLPLHGALPI